MIGFNLPFEKIIRKKFSQKTKGIVTPSSVAADFNNKSLNKLLLGIKIIWFPIQLIAILSLVILLLSIF